MTRLTAVATEVLGPRLAADTGEWGAYAWSEHVLGAPGYRIAGGSDEIQRTIIAERVLGLPAEPRLDVVPTGWSTRSTTTRRRSSWCGSTIAPTSTDPAESP
jgi:hypothetical protein